MDSFIKPHRTKWQGKVCAAYMMIHVHSGKIYVGSTKDIQQRKKDHEKFLALGTHENSNVQEAYNVDPHFEYFTVLTHTREEAYTYEQQMLDDYKDTDLLLNKALDARDAFKHVKRGIPPERLELFIRLTKERNAAKKGKPIPAETLERMRIAQLKNSKAVSINGVEYSSMKEASRKLNFSIGGINGRIKSTNPLYKEWRLTS